MGEIEFDFCAASEAMSQLEDAANRMNTKALPDFVETIQKISESWSGEAGERFQEIAGRECEQMRQTALYLKHTDACLQEAILTAKKIEEKTKEIAELRTY